MKQKAIENAYPDLVLNGLPKWDEDGDLIKWLNSLGAYKILWGVISKKEL